MNRDALQQNWYALVEKENPTATTDQTTDAIEQPARSVLAALLREYADKVQRGDPAVFGYFESKRGPFEEIRVVLSHPWGG